MAPRPDRRAELAAAAYEVVAEGGIDRLSLRTVARRVGATTGLLSHHFADRRDLIGAALEHAAGAMLSRVASVPEDAHPVELLAAVLPTDEPTVEVWRFSLSVRTAALFDDELRQFDRRISDHWEQHLPARLAGLVPGDGLEAARHLVALVDGISFHAVLDPASWPPERQIEHLRAGFVAVEHAAFIKPQTKPQTKAKTTTSVRPAGAEERDCVTDRAGPLAHVKVLDLTRMFPGAFCTLMLADQGAEVVKVEAPRGGDGLRSMAPPGRFNATHVALNRGKRSLALDLRSPGAGDVLRRLVRWADVVVESHRPGQLDRLGLGYDVIREENPRLIWCSVTGFGDTGPNKDAPGHDLTYLGYAGLLGRLGEGPATPPATTVSIPLAALTATVGILSALAEATRTGQGRRLDANMVDSAMWVLAEDIARAANEPAPGWPTFAARNVYRCADGRAVTVAASEPKSWAALCEGLDIPDLASHQLGVDDEGPVIDRLTQVFATKPAAAWVAIPGLAGGVGPVNEPADLLDDPQVTERGSVVALDGSGTRVLANPIRFDGEAGDTATRARTDPPDLGADTDDVLATVGFAEEEIASLRAEQVIA